MLVQTGLIKSGKAVKSIMVIRGRLAGIIIRIAPKVYKKYATTYKQGNTVLYVKLMKSLYGLMEASLMFYQKPVKTWRPRDLKPTIMTHVLPISK